MSNLNGEIDENREMSNNSTTKRSIPMSTNFKNYLKTKSNLPTTNTKKAPALIRNESEKSNRSSTSTNKPPLNPQSLLADISISPPSGRPKSMTCSSRLPSSRSIFPAKNCNIKRQKSNHELDSKVNSSMSSNQSFGSTTSLNSNNGQASGSKLTKKPSKEFQSLKVAIEKQLIHKMPATTGSSNSTAKSNATAASTRPTYQAPAAPVPLVPIMPSQIPMPPALPAFFMNQGSTPGVPPAPPLPPPPPPMPALGLFTKQSGNDWRNRASLDSVGSSGGHSTHDSSNVSNSSSDDVLDRFKIEIPEPRRNSNVSGTEPEKSSEPRKSFTRPLSSSIPANARSSKPKLIDLEFKNELERLFASSNEGATNFSRTSSFRGSYPSSLNTTLGNQSYLPTRTESTPRPISPGQNRSASNSSIPPPPPPMPDNFLRPSRSTMSVVSKPKSLAISSSLTTLANGRVSPKQAKMMDAFHSLGPDMAAPCTQLVVSKSLDPMPSLELVNLGSNGMASVLNPTYDEAFVPSLSALVDKVPIQTATVYLNENVELKLVQNNKGLEGCFNIELKKSQHDQSNCNLFMLMANGRKSLLVEQKEGSAKNTCKLIKLSNANQKRKASGESKNNSSSSSGESSSKRSYSLTIGNDGKAIRRPRHRHAHKTKDKQRPKDTDGLPSSTSVSSCSSTSSSGSSDSQSTSSCSSIEDEKEAAPNDSFIICSQSASSICISSSSTHKPRSKNRRIHVYDLEKATLTKTLSTSQEFVGEVNQATNSEASKLAPTAEEKPAISYDLFDLATKMDDNNESCLRDSSPISEHKFLLMLSDKEPSLELENVTAEPHQGCCTSEIVQAALEYEVKKEEAALDTEDSVELVLESGSDMNALESLQASNQNLATDGANILKTSMLSIDDFQHLNEESATFDSETNNNTINTIIEVKSRNLQLQSPGQLQRSPSFVDSSNLPECAVKMDDVIPSIRIHSPPKIEEMPPNEGGSSDEMALKADQASNANQSILTVPSNETPNANDDNALAQSIIEPTTSNTAATLTATGVSQITGMTNSILDSSSSNFVLSDLESDQNALQDAAVEANAKTAIVQVEDTRASVSISATTSEAKSSLNDQPGRTGANESDEEETASKTRTRCRKSLTSSGATKKNESDASVKELNNTNQSFKANASREEMETDEINMDIADVDEDETNAGSQSKENQLMKSKELDEVNSSNNKTLSKSSASNRKKLNKKSQLRTKSKKTNDSNSIGSAGGGGKPNKKSSANRNEPTRKSVPNEANSCQCKCEVKPEQNACACVHLSKQQSQRAKAHKDQSNNGSNQHRIILHLNTAANNNNRAQDETLRDAENISDIDDEQGIDQWTDIAGYDNGSALSVDGPPKQIDQDILKETSATTTTTPTTSTKIYDTLNQDKSTNNNSGQRQQGLKSKREELNMIEEEGGKNESDDNHNNNNNNKNNEDDDDDNKAINLVEEEKIAEKECSNALSKDVKARRYPSSEDNEMRDQAAINEDNGEQLDGKRSSELKNGMKEDETTNSSPDLKASTSPASLFLDAQPRESPPPSGSDNHKGGNDGDVGVEKEPILDGTEREKPVEKDNDNDDDASSKYSILSSASSSTSSSSSSTTLPLPNSFSSLKSIKNNKEETRDSKRDKLLDLNQLEKNFNEKPATSTETESEERRTSNLDSKLKSDCFQDNGNSLKENTELNEEKLIKQQIQKLITGLILESESAIKKSKDCQSSDEQVMHPLDTNQMRDANETNNCIQHNVYLEQAKAASGAFGLSRYIDDAPPNVVSLSSKDLLKSMDTDQLGRPNSVNTTTGPSLDSLDLEGEEFEIDHPRVIVANKNPNFEVDVDVNVSLIDPNESLTQNDTSHNASAFQSNHSSGLELPSSKSKKIISSSQRDNCCWNLEVEQSSELSEIPEIKIDFEYQLANMNHSHATLKNQFEGANKILVPTITATIVAPPTAEELQQQKDQQMNKFDEELVKQRTREGLKFWKDEEEKQKRCDTISAATAVFTNNTIYSNGSKRGTYDATFSATSLSMVTTSATLASNGAEEMGEETSTSTSPLVSRRVKDKINVFEAKKNAADLAASKVNGNSVKSTSGKERSLLPVPKKSILKQDAREKLMETKNNLQSEITSTIQSLLENFEQKRTSGNGRRKTIDGVIKYVSKKAIDEENMSDYLKYEKYLEEMKLQNSNMEYRINYEDKNNYNQTSKMASDEEDGEQVEIPIKKLIDLSMSNGYSPVSPNTSMMILQQNQHQFAQEQFVILNSQNPLEQRPLNVKSHSQSSLLQNSQNTETNNLQYYDIVDPATLTANKSFGSNDGDLEEVEIVIDLNNLKNRQNQLAIPGNSSDQEMVSPNLTTTNFAQDDVLRGLIGSLLQTNRKAYIDDILDGLKTLVKPNDLAKIQNKSDFPDNALRFIQRRFGSLLNDQQFFQPFNESEGAQEANAGSGIEEAANKMLPFDMATTELTVVKQIREELLPSSSYTDVRDADMDADGENYYYNSNDYENTQTYDYENTYGFYSNAESTHNNKSHDNDTNLQATPSATITNMKSNPRDIMKIEEETLYIVEKRRQVPSNHTSSLQFNASTNNNGSYFSDHSVATNSTSTTTNEVDKEVRKNFELKPKESPTSKRSATSKSDHSLPHVHNDQALYDLNKSVVTRTELQQIEHQYEMLRLNLTNIIDLVRQQAESLSKASKSQHQSADTGDINDYQLHLFGKEHSRAGVVHPILVMLFDKQNKDNFKFTMEQTYHKSIIDTHRLNRKNEINVIAVVNLFYIFDGIDMEAELISKSKVAAIAAKFNNDNVEDLPSIKSSSSSSLPSASSNAAAKHLSLFDRFSIIQTLSGGAEDKHLSSVPAGKYFVNVRYKCVRVDRNQMNHQSDKKLKFEKETIVDLAFLPVSIRAQLIFEFENYLKNHYTKCLADQMVNATAASTTKLETGLTNSFKNIHLPILCMLAIDSSTIQSSINKKRDETIQSALRRHSQDQAQLLTSSFTEIAEVDKFIKQLELDLNSYYICEKVSNIYEIGQDDLVNVNSIIEIDSLNLACNLVKLNKLDALASYQCVQQYNKLILDFLAEMHRSQVGSNNSQYFFHNNQEEPSDFKKFFLIDNGNHFKCLIPMSDLIDDSKSKDGTVFTNTNYDQVDSVGRVETNRLAAPTEAEDARRLSNNSIVIENIHKRQNYIFSKHLMSVFPPEMNGSHLNPTFVNNPSERPAPNVTSTQSNNAERVETTTGSSALFDLLSDENYNIRSIKLKQQPSIHNSQPFTKPVSDNTKQPDQKQEAEQLTKTNGVEPMQDTRSSFDLRNGQTSLNVAASGKQKYRITIDHGNNEIIKEEISKANATNNSGVERASENNFVEKTDSGKQVRTEIKTNQELDDREKQIIQKLLNGKAATALTDNDEEVVRTAATIISNKPLSTAQLQALNVSEAKSAQSASDVGGVSTIPGLKLLENLEKKQQKQLNESNKLIEKNLFHHHYHNHNKPIVSEASLSMGSFASGFINPQYTYDMVESEYAKFESTRSGSFRSRQRPAYQQPGQPPRNVNEIEFASFETDRLKLDLQLDPIPAFDFTDARDKIIIKEIDRMFSTIRDHQSANAKAQAEEEFIGLSKQTRSHKSANRNRDPIRSNKSKMRKRSGSWGYSSNKRHVRAKVMELPFAEDLNMMARKVGISDFQDSFGGEEDTVEKVFVRIDDYLNQEVSHALQRSYSADFLNQNAGPRTRIRYVKIPNQTIKTQSICSFDYNSIPPMIAQQMQQQAQHHHMRNSSCGRNSQTITPQLPTFSATSASTGATTEYRTAPYDLRYWSILKLLEEERQQIELGEQSNTDGYLDGMEQIRTAATGASAFASSPSLNRASFVRQHGSAIDNKQSAANKSQNMGDNSALKSSSCNELGFLAGNFTTSGISFDTQTGAILTAAEFTDLNDINEDLQKFLSKDDLDKEIEQIKKEKKSAKVLLPKIDPSQVTASIGSMISANGTASPMFNHVKNFVINDPITTSSTNKLQQQSQTQIQQPQFVIKEKCTVKARETDAQRNDQFFNATENAVFSPKSLSKSNGYPSQLPPIPPTDKLQKGAQRNSRYQSPAMHHHEGAHQNQAEILASLVEKSVNLRDLNSSINSNKSEVICEGHDQRQLFKTIAGGNGKSYSASESAANHKSPQVAASTVLTPVSTPTPTHERTERLSTPCFHSKPIGHIQRAMSPVSPMMNYYRPTMRDHSPYHHQHMAHMQHMQYHQAQYAHHQHHLQHMNHQQYQQYQQQQQQQIQQNFKPNMPTMPNMSPIPMSPMMATPNLNSQMMMMNMSSLQNQAIMSNIKNYILQSSPVQYIKHD